MHTSWLSAKAPLYFHLFYVILVIQAHLKCDFCLSLLVLFYTSAQLFFCLLSLSSCLHDAEWVPYNTPAAHRSAERLKPSFTNQTEQFSSFLYNIYFVSPSRFGFPNNGVGSGKMALFGFCQHGTDNEFCHAISCC